MAGYKETMSLSSSRRKEASFIHFKFWLLRVVVVPWFVAVQWKHPFSCSLILCNIFLRIQFINIIFRCSFSQMRIPLKRQLPVLSAIIRFQRLPPISPHIPFRSRHSTAIIIIIVVAQKKVGLSVYPTPTKKKKRLGIIFP